MDKTERNAYRPGTCPLLGEIILNEILEKRAIK